MRLLGATRLSRKTDESTSIERQREQIIFTAKARGDYPPVFITEDTDVSGGISPFLRESLGPWLTDPEKISQWDGLIVAKLDRLTRSLSDFDELVSWLDRNGKTLISVSESLDLSTSNGRMFANLLAMFAQFERERMSERRKDAANKIKENGWWAGFGYPYGSRPVKMNDHWEIEQDPINYPVLKRIAHDIISGHSSSAIARKLNAEGVPTPNGGKEWIQNTIREIFENDKCILEYDLLAQVREAFDKTRQPWTKRGDTGMLVNVASCECGASLYSKRYTSKGHQYEYYTCSANCGRRRIPMADLDREVEEHMSVLGSPVYSKEIKEGKSVKKELGDIERKIRNLSLDDPDYLTKQAELMSARQQIKANASSPDQVTYVDTGMMAGDYWQTLDKTAKRQLLLISGTKVTGARRTPDGKIICDITSPMDGYTMTAIKWLGDED